MALSGCAGRGVDGGGVRTRDLRVTSPTSYRTALLRAPSPTLAFICCGFMRRVTDGARSRHLLSIFYPVSSARKDFGSGYIGPLRPVSRRRVLRASPGSPIKFEEASKVGRRRVLVSGNMLGASVESPLGGAEEGGSNASRFEQCARG